MSNKMLFAMIGLVCAAILVTFMMNINHVRENKAAEHFISFDHIRGMAVKQNGKQWTLNLKQQIRVAEILNDSKPAEKRMLAKGSNVGDLEEIIIYRFPPQTDVVITPLLYFKHNLVFSAPEWLKEGYLVENSAGKLEELLKQTYDHPKK